MSFLSDLYNVPPETIRKMVKEGIISCSWDVKEAAYKMHKQGMPFGQIADKLGCSQSTAHLYYQDVRKKLEGF